MTTANDLSESTKHEFYQALIDKNPRYEGVFFVSVRTTGVFCRPTCPARKPKFENCEFYKTAEAALLASFRPCLRCRPLFPPGHASDLVKRLVEAVEANPAKRWKDCDFQNISVDVSTARRQFKKRFGMTFVSYARARRMGIAMKQIKEGERSLMPKSIPGMNPVVAFAMRFLKSWNVSHTFQEWTP